jgi:tetratricopeptide (TPR) repeat protein
LSNNSNNIRHIRLQNLRDCTVQIRHPATHAIAGAGVVISQQGQIVTCARVVRAAGVALASTSHAPGTSAPSQLVAVSFPQAHSRTSERHVYQARVVMPDQTVDDDTLVMLRLLDGPTPLMPEQVAIPGTPERSADHAFSCYGYQVALYPPFPHPPSVRAKVGVQEADSIPIVTGGSVLIQSDGESLSDSSSRTELIKLRSQHMYHEMYGSPVLDRERNLVVGIVSHVLAFEDGAGQASGMGEAGGAAPPGFVERVEHLAWATTTRSLQYAPFNIPLQNQPLSKRSGIQPRTDMAAARAMALSKPGIALYGTPPMLSHWVGREALLFAIRDDWVEPGCRITSLVGPAGAGKSSLVRFWLNTLLQEKTPQQLDGVFWWSFAERASVDEFFLAAISHFSGKRIDPRRFPSTNSRAQVLGGMLSKGHYLFVLDGVDAVQHQTGDQYGLLTSPNLREFLEYLATPTHQSYCFVTSRVPLLDLLDYTTCIQRDVGHLSQVEGYTLLLQLGIAAPATTLEQLVLACNGHALTLHMIGMALRPAPSPASENHHSPPNEQLAFSQSNDVGEAGERDEGDEAGERDEGDEAGERDDAGEKARSVADALTEHMPELWTHTFSSTGAYIPVPAQFQYLAHVYHAYLSADERLLLLWMSFFRRPVTEAAIGHLLRVEPAVLEHLRAEGCFYVPLAEMDEEPFMAIFQRLVVREVLFFDEERRHFTIVPLLRDYYRSLAQRRGDDAPDTPPIIPEAQLQALHHRIKEYYLSIAPPVIEQPSGSVVVEDLVPLIEAVYHACCASAYAEAWDIYWEGIAQQQSFVLISQLGMYETARDLLLAFFPDGDYTQEPRIEDSIHQHHIFKGVGQCLMYLGRLDEAVVLYQRSIECALASSAWHAAMTEWYVLVDVYIALGRLDDAAVAVRRVLDVAREVESRRDELLSLAYQARVAHLRGKMVMAGAVFYHAQAIERELNPEVWYLYSVRGSWHADYLQQTGGSSYARSIIEKNMEICRRNRWYDELSRAYRVLGDIEAREGHHEEARQYYDEAVRLARTLPDAQPLLIKALLARGRWAVGRGRERVRVQRSGDGQRVVGGQEQQPDESPAAPRDEQDQQTTKKSRRRIAITHMEEDEQPYPGRQEQPQPRDQKSAPTARKNSLPTRERSLENADASQVRTTASKPGMIMTEIGDSSTIARGRVTILVDQTDARVTRIQKRSGYDATVASRPGGGTERLSLTERARSDFAEALACAVAWGYRRYEEEVRVALDSMQSRGG